MPHPVIDNFTPLIVEPLLLLDEDGRPALTVVVKASFAIEAPGLVLLAEQPGLCYSGELHYPEAPVSSYRREPELTPLKLATDVAVIGHAHAPRPGTRVLEVGVRVGSLTRVAWVSGERVWYRRRLGDPQLSQAAPFDRIPLCYERAFGGPADLRNPVGCGHRRAGTLPVDGERAPNIEDPAAPIRDHRERPAPAGFGFVSPNWHPRAELAGTFDMAWAAQRKPLLPRDFDLRFYSAASAGLLASGYLRGNEPIAAFGLVRDGSLSFELPGLPPPSLRIRSDGRSDMMPPLQLDTVILDFDAGMVTLLWRVRVRLDRGHHELRALELRSPAAMALPRTYVEAVNGPFARAANSAHEELGP